MKHTKLFYRTIARIRVVNQKNSAVFIDRFVKVFKIGYVRAVKLKTELVEAGVLKDWDLDNIKNIKGNIVWENLKKYRVPKEITQKETERVRKERL